MHKPPHWYERIKFVGQSQITIKSQETQFKHWFIFSPLLPYKKCFLPIEMQYIFRAGARGPYSAQSAIREGIRRFALPYYKIGGQYFNLKGLEAFTKAARMQYYVKTTQNFILFIISCLKMSSFFIINLRLKRNFCLQMPFD